MSLFGSSVFGPQDPGKCCYWEDGTKVGDADRTPCQPFSEKKRENSHYWVENMSLGQPIYPGIVVNRKRVCYALHIFKHVESVGLECNNELQLNDYLKKLINIEDNKIELNKLLQGSDDVGLCLKDNNNNNILLKIKDIGYDYLIYHLSKRTDETCSIGDWEIGLDNYSGPKIDNNINPMQYSLFKTDEMKKDDDEAIYDLNNNSPSLPDISPASVVDPPPSPKGLQKGSPKTPRGLRKKISSLIKRIINNKSKKNALSQFPQTGKIAEKQVKIENDIKDDESKKIHYEKKLSQFDEPVSVLNPNALEYRPSFTGNTPFPLKGGKTKKRIKKRKTKKRKTKAKKTKRKH